MFCALGRGIMMFPDGGQRDHAGGALNLLSFLLKPQRMLDALGFDQRLALRAIAAWLGCRRDANTQARFEAGFSTGTDVAAHHRRYQRA
jgi:hypothetical protein